MQGKNVYQFTEDVLQPNNYTYWVPPPPPFDPTVPPAPQAPGVQGINVSDHLHMILCFMSDARLRLVVNASKRSQAEIPKHTAQWHTKQLFALYSNKFSLMAWIIM